MRRLFRLAAPLCAMLLAMSVVLLPSSYLDQVLAQSAAFLETFDGSPPLPTDYSNPTNWDILTTGFDPHEVGSSVGQHGPHCEPPGFPYTSLNTHPLLTRAGGVFQCNGHIMTAPGITGYGAVYMTPPAVMDLNAGSTAVLKWDMSTLRTSSRDWVGVVLTPYNQHHVLAYNNVDNHVPPDNIHIVMGGTSVFLVTERVGGGTDIPVPGDTNTQYQDVLRVQVSPLFEDAARRDTFEVALSPTHIRMC